MYVIWETSPCEAARYTLHRPPSLGHPLTAPAAHGAAPRGGSGQNQSPQLLQQSAPSAQDAAARSRLVDAVRRSEEEPLAAAAASSHAELQQLLPLQQRLSARCCQVSSHRCRVTMTAPLCWYQMLHLAESRVHTIALLSAH